MLQVKYVEMNDKILFLLAPHWNSRHNSTKIFSLLIITSTHLMFLSLPSDKTQNKGNYIQLYYNWIITFMFQTYHWESLEELLLESVDITSTSSVVWFLVSIETLPCPPTVMWISPDGCHANWFCWDAGSSESIINSNVILFLGLFNDAATA